MARLHDMLLYPGDIKAVRRAGIVCLRELEAHLTEARFAGRIYLVGDIPPLPTSPAFPMWRLRRMAASALIDYPSIRLWMRSIRSLDRFIEMPGIHRLHELKPAPEVVEA